MDPHNLKQLLEIMEEMVGLERALADLYQTCSEAFPEDTQFWLAIKHQEKHHAESIRKMAALVLAYPHEFALGRTFNATAIHTVKHGIIEHIDALKQHQIPRIKMLIIARDIENSVIEAHYRDLVKTSNIEFNNLVDQIDTQTMQHKNLLIKKIAASKQQ
ncbi:MAG: hypothetical protein BWY57_00096 [Betaproteobacteria bacterium ADurb.Bin341]|nr:MAG: hypothetical protein BWY57_00096 [Betaproteobacteria bacterium ADurb.Bin341]